MTLQELLRGLVYDSGALGALAMTADGDTVAEFRSDDLFDLQGCATECAALLSVARQASAHLESGGLEELSFVTERLRIVMMTVTWRLSLLLVLPAGAVQGRAVYLMRRDRHRFADAATVEPADDSLSAVHKGLP